MRPKLHTHRNAISGAKSDANQIFDIISTDGIIFMAIKLRPKRAVMNHKSVSLCA